MTTRQRLALAAYAGAMRLLVPAMLARWWWRGRKEPGYRRHLAERFGFYSPPPARPLLWVHAVSVGETRAAEPLIDAHFVRIGLADQPNEAAMMTLALAFVRDQNAS